MKVVWRPAILLSVLGLIGIAGVSMFKDLPEIASGCVGGLIALSTKIMDSEEATMRKTDG